MSFLSALGLAVGERGDPVREERRTAAEVGELRARVLDAVQHALGATLR